MSLRFVTSCSNAFLYMHDQHYLDRKVFGSPVQVLFQNHKGQTYSQLSTPVSRGVHGKEAHVQHLSQTSQVLESSLAMQEPLWIRFFVDPKFHDSDTCLPKNWNPWEDYDRPVLDFQARCAYLQHAYREAQRAHGVSEENLQPLHIVYSSIFGERQLV